MAGSGDDEAVPENRLPKKLPMPESGLALSEAAGVSVAGVAATAVAAGGGASDAADGAGTAAAAVAAGRASVCGAPGSAMPAVL